MKTLLIFLVLICVSFQVLDAQDSLTVERAVQLVLETHPAIKQAMADTRVAKARVSQTSSIRFPDITTEAAYTHIGPIPEFFFGGQNLALAPEDNYDAHIVGRYTVFDFGKMTAAIDASQSRVQTTLDALELTKTNLTMQTIRAFYTIMFLRRSEQVQNEQIEALTQHLSVTEKRVTAGTATNFDVLTTRVRVAAAQNQKVEIQNSLQKQESILHQLLDLPADSPLTISGSFQRIPVTLNRDSLFQLALQQRTEIKLAHDAEESAKLQKNASSLGDMPSLKVNATYGLKNGYEPNIYPMRGNWMWGAQVQVPIFDGGWTNHQVEEAQAAIESEQAHTQDAERQIRSDVEQAIADVQASWSRIQISDIQFQQAHEAVAIARTRYETGSVTNLDLLDAETAESSARLMNLQALYRFVISRYELGRAVGKPLFK
jgi:outer membrane protein